MRVLLLTRYEQLGSSSRVRFYQYLPFLRAHGIECTPAPFFTDSYVRRLYSNQRPSLRTVLMAYRKRLTILLSSTAFDVIWVEKELFPWLPAVLEVLLHRRNIPYVVDYDDAVFHRYDKHHSFLVRALFGRKIDTVMRQAALVIAGNEYIAERARRAGARRVECLPSVVDVSRYTIQERDTQSPFRIGWIGSPVTARYLDLVRQPMSLLSRDVPLELILIGAGNTQPFQNVSTTFLPWSEDLELKIGQLFDVGIMPLVDGPFERGKCGYKLIQYMAGGLPVVASPVGVNRDIVEPGVNGFLCESSTDWLTALTRLWEDRAKRKLMGQAGRQKAEQLYNLQVTAPRLLNLLVSLMKP